MTSRSARSARGACATASRTTRVRTIGRSRLWIGLALYCLLAALAAATMNRLALVMLVVLPVAAIVVTDVPLGLVLTIWYSALVMLLKRLMPNLSDNQVGVVIEGLLVLLGVRFAWDLSRRRDFAVLRTPLTRPLLVLAAYLGLEVFNPLQPSIRFGLYGSRDTLRLLGFFLALYYLRRPEQIRRFLGAIAALCLAEGGYGIWQHHHGLLYQEYNWLFTSLSYRTHILFGYIRIFGTLGDAATFGFLEITGALLFMGLALTAGPGKFALLSTGLVACLYAMVLSYSRGPMVAMAAASAVVVAASRNFKLAVGMVVLAAAGWFVLTHLGDHRLAARVLTATDPTADPSYQVREGYMSEYLPRILSHPFGTGLYTAGASGLLVTGGHYIPGTTVGVPTDNQYFKYALEIGWVGLAIFVRFFVGLCWQTYRAYQGLEEPRLKAWALGLLGVFSCYLVGAASNDILVQKPLSEWFWIGAGVSMRLWQLAYWVPYVHRCGAAAPETPGRRARDRSAEGKGVEA